MSTPKRRSPITLPPRAPKKPRRTLVDIMNKMSLDERAPIIRKNLNKAFEPLSMIYDDIQVYLRERGNDIFLGSGTFKNVYEWEGKAISIEKVRVTQSAIKHVGWRYGDTKPFLEKAMKYIVDDKINRVKKLMQFVQDDNSCDTVIIPSDIAVVKRKDVTYIVCKYEKCNKDDLFDAFDTAIYGPNNNRIRADTQVQQSIQQMLYPICNFLLRAFEKKFYFTDIKLENIMQCPCGDENVWVLGDLDDAVNGDDFQANGKLPPNFEKPFTYVYNSQMWLTTDDLARQTLYCILCVLGNIYYYRRYLSDRIKAFVVNVFPDNCEHKFKRNRGFFLEEMDMRFGIDAAKFLETFMYDIIRGSREPGYEQRKCFYESTNLYMKPYGLISALRQAWEANTMVNWETIIERRGLSYTDVGHNQLYRTLNTQDQMNFLLDHNIHPKQFAQYVARTRPLNTKRERSNSTTFVQPVEKRVEGKVSLKF